MTPCSIKSVMFKLLNASKATVPFWGRNWLLNLILRQFSTSAACWNPCRTLKLPKCFQHAAKLENQFCICCTKIMTVLIVAGRTEQVKACEFSSNCSKVNCTVKNLSKGHFLIFHMRMLRHSYFFPFVVLIKTCRECNTVMYMLNW